MPGPDSDILFQFLPIRLGGEELLSVDSNLTRMIRRQALSLSPLAFFACLLTPEINSGAMAYFDSAAAPLALFACPLIPRWSWYSITELTVRYGEKADTATLWKGMAIGSLISSNTDKKTWPELTRN